MNKLKSEPFNVEEVKNIIDQNKKFMSHINNYNYQYFLSNIAISIADSIYIKKVLDSLNELI